MTDKVIQRLEEIAEEIVSVRHTGCNKLAIEQRNDREGSGRKVGGCQRKEGPDHVGFCKHLNLF